MSKIVRVWGGRLEPIVGEEGGLSPSLPPPCPKQRSFINSKQTNGKGMKIEDKIVQFLNVRADYLKQRSPLLRKRLDRAYNSLLAALDSECRKQMQYVRDLYNEARGF